MRGERPSPRVTAARSAIAEPVPSVARVLRHVVRVPANTHGILSRCTSMPASRQVSSITSCCAEMRPSPSLAGNSFQQRAVPPGQSTQSRALPRRQQPAGMGTGLPKMVTCSAALGAGVVRGSSWAATLPDLLALQPVAATTRAVTKLERMRNGSPSPVGTRERARARPGRGGARPPGVSSPASAPSRAGRGSPRRSAGRSEGRCSGSPRSASA